MLDIMIIEDDTRIREELSLLLCNAGYCTTLISEFEDIISQVNNTLPDLILLDLGLPGQDGFSVCTNIRKATTIPIIIVTSHDTVMDELQALSLGADDYITKPYNIPLLLARIKNVLRRSGEKADPEILEAKNVNLNLSKGNISSTIDKTIIPIELTKNEIRILSYLIRNKGEIVSRMDLIEALWNDHIYIDDNTLSVNVTRLRAKLTSLGFPDYILTRRGMGYQI
ncbi:MAG: response regulator transcription factor [Suipraeoptans sp.]